MVVVMDCALAATEMATASTHMVKNLHSLFVIAFSCLG
jgi:hypothetical protein